MSDPTPADVNDRGEDATWFEDVVNQNSRAIIQYFARRAPRQDSEDLASEVFLTAWRRRDDIPRDAVLPWLYTTAGYTLANYRRKHKASPTDELSLLASSAPGPEQTAADRDELRRALEELSERDRQVLYLAAWEGLKGEELAQVLGISRSGADAALSRARKRLREAR